jgi:type IX secretion system PorP/SprF family membrane protein
MIRAGVFLACCLLTGKLLAQDPHFSQFFASPLTLNPALTGKFNGTFRLTGNHRNQWPTINNAYITTAFSADFHVMKNKIPNNDNWGVGFSGYADRSANSAVSFNFGSVSTAYHKGLDEDGNHQIGAGFQMSYANMLINTSVLNFEDQLTSNGFTGISAETFNGATLSSKYVDINAGFLYNGSTSDNNNFYLGVSMYHINRPKQNFTGGQYVLNPRTTIHGGAYFALTPNATMHTSAIHMMQAGASETVVGGAIQLIANPEMEKPVSLYAGSWVRFNDAIIPYLGLEFNDLRIGVSYDLNTSTLRTASLNRGGIEVSLIYVRRPSDERPIKCPKF